MNQPVPVERSDRGAAPRGAPATPWRTGVPDGPELRERNQLMLDMSSGWPPTGVFTPPADIEETPDAYILELELPGIDRDDIHIDAGVQELTVRAKVRERPRIGVLRHQGRRTGSFLYRVGLPAGLDLDHIDAAYHDGILTIRLPRDQAAELREIKIR